MFKHVVRPRASFGQHAFPYRFRLLPSPFSEESKLSVQHADNVLPGHFGKRPSNAGNFHRHNHLFKTIGGKK